MFPMTIPLLGMHLRPFRQARRNPFQNLGRFRYLPWGCLLPWPAAVAAAAKTSNWPAKHLIAQYELGGFPRNGFFAAISSLACFFPGLMISVVVAVGDRQCLLSFTAWRLLTLQSETSALQVTQ
jgi:hypothetical protein